MIDVTSKNLRRRQRQQRSRRHLQGGPGRPRLNVFRSLNHIYAQLVDDSRGVTLAAVSSRKLALKPGGNLAAAKAVGEAIAAAAKTQGVETVVFDRAGYPYPGGVAALAAAARAAGLKF